MKNGLRKQRVALEGLILFTVVIGMVLASSSTRADSSMDQVTWTIQPSCTLSSSISSGSEHTASIMSGEYKTDIGTTMVTVVCNDSEGLDIYAVGSSNNKLGNTDLISSVSSDFNISTGIYSSGNTNSSWSMKLTNMNDGLTPVSGKFGSYMLVPNTWDKVAYRDSSTGATASASFQTTYDVYAGSNQPSGIYTGQVKYIVVHPYNTTPPEISKTISDLEYMQDFAALSNDEKNSVFGSMSAQTSYTLKDSRDEQEYTIAKLEDGKVWMTKNLNLPGGTVLGSDDTDFDSSYILPNTNGWAISNNKLVLPVSSDASYAFEDMGIAEVYNSGNASCIDNDPCYSYYSWDAATAGSNRIMSSSDTDANYSICPKGWRLPSGGNDSDYSSLVTKYGSGANFYNSAGVGTTPNFELSGEYFMSGLYGVGSIGYYWSSTVPDISARAYVLNFGSSSVDYSDIENIKGGLPVRCIAR